MGAWGSGPFENDEAGDWSFGLEDGGPEVVAEGLDGAEGDGGVVAAAAVVAHAWGVPVQVDEEVAQWVTGQDVATLRALGEQAVAALDVVLGDSELKDLWEESGDDRWARETSAWRDQLAAAVRGGTS